jgi:predicted ribonuclease YlaK
MADVTTDHQHRFIQHYWCDYDNYDWVVQLREAKGEILPLPEDLLGRGFRVNDPIVFNGNTLARVRQLRPGVLGVSLVPTGKMNFCGLEPRGFEQNFAFELLLDPTVQCVTLWGIAGSGKTTLALAAAIHQCRAGKYHEGIHLMKPVAYVGKSTGLLPGELDQKIAPFLASMTQHLEALMGQRVSVPIHCQAIEYQRGANYTNGIIIIDEGQNLNEHEMFTLLTRVGEGAKVIICGDLTQVDDRDIKKKRSSGLSMVLNNFRKSWDEDIADVQFFKSERRGISLKAVLRLSDMAQ